MCLHVMKLMGLFINVLIVAPRTDLGITIGLCFIHRLKNDILYQYYLLLASWQEKVLQELMLTHVL